MATRTRPTNNGDNQRGRTSRAHSGRSGGNGQPVAKAKAPAVAPKVVDSVVVDEFITVRELASLMERSPIDLIKVLMQFGVMAPITQNIDHDTAVIVGEELGIKVKWPERADAAEPQGKEEQAPPPAPVGLVDQVLGSEEEANLVERAPVVAILGHVDHGKTTLLDGIRHTHVVDTEAGGITQHTGAYQVEVNGRKITFLDTPGHEAFTSMRARGAQVTDIVVLVVAADDGVMPQTKEAINHARAANVPIIVALNKVDKANANVERVKEELAKEGLQPEDWGGETIVVPVSALRKQGLTDLLDNILLVAELEQFRSNPQGRCVGTVIEAEMDKFRGATATVLVQNGTLKRGDAMVVGTTWGRVKAMGDFEGKPLKQAGPGTPVVVLGLQEVPKAGDVFEVVASDRSARDTADQRQLAADAAAQDNTPRKQMSLQDLFARFEEGETEVLNVIARVDVQGSLEPVIQSLQNLSTDAIGLKVLQVAMGDISESDVMLAEASDAIIIGFNVNTDKPAQLRAEQSGVEIRHYNIIYKMIEDLKLALEGMLEPVFEAVTIGHAQVLKIFKVRRGGLVAGCSVSDGVIKRNARVRLKRNGELVREARIGDLKRFTEDVSEVRAGFECGINLEGVSSGIEEGDIIEVYEMRQVS